MPVPPFTTRHSDIQQWKHRFHCTFRLRLMFTSIFLQQCPISWSAYKLSARSHLFLSTSL
jgi:hypothetical protein